MRAAIYARVSTEDQAKEGFSIAAQIKRLNAYCKARGWQVAGEYVDEGFSGRETKRPSYQRMMEEKDGWDVLVVLKMDRIHRNSRNFTTMMDNLSAWRKEFNSMQESFDTTTAIGRFVMDIIQRIAQLESEQTGERVKMGMTQKAKKGNGYLGFGEPYGYEFRDRGLLVKEEEAQQVREMYSAYLAGASLQMLVDTLNDQGVPSKKGGRWTKESVAKILRNPLYCGQVRWDGIVRDGPQQPLIEEGLFLRVQMEIRTRSRRCSEQDHPISIGKEAAHG